jgi:hypothetical protein
MCEDRLVKVGVVAVGAEFRDRWVAIEGLLAETSRGMVHAICNVARRAMGVNAWAELKISLREPAAVATRLWNR